MKKKIKVVCAIIENSNGEVLCALRSEDMPLSNSWEFPGGKVEEGENIQEAIEREILEELGCTIDAYNIFNDNTHEYEKFIVNLISVKCKITSGVPVANEHAALIWLKRNYLKSLIWAPADIPAVNALINELNT